VRRFKWFIAAAVVIVAAGVAGGAYYIFGGSSPPPPKLPTASSLASGPTATSPAGTWRVVAAQNTYVGYRVQELFAGETIHKDAVGRTPGVTGTMTCSDQQVQAVEIAANLTALKSDRGPRDTYLHTHALQTDTIPNATFALTTPNALPSAPRLGAELPVPISGKLTVHNVTRDISTTLTARWDGATIDVIGTVPIKFADYGIEKPKTAVVETEDHGTLELSLHFTRA
jgi:polyisoprenoid-binding protein YceI